MTPEEVSADRLIVADATRFVEESSDFLQRARGKAVLRWANRGLSALTLLTEIHLNCPLSLPEELRNRVRDWLNR